MQWQQLCGAAFKRRQHYKPSGNYVAWCCNTHITNRNACSTMYIRDEDIKAAFCRMIRKLQTAHAQILKPFVAGLKGTNNKERLRQVLALEEQIEKNAEQIMVLTNSSGKESADIGSGQAYKGKRRYFKKYQRRPYPFG